MEPEICCWRIHKDSVLGLLTARRDNISEVKLSFKKGINVFKLSFSGPCETRRAHRIPCENPGEAFTALVRNPKKNQNESWRVKGRTALGQPVLKKPSAVHSHGFAEKDLKEK